jgi:hypothetical protein
VSRREKVGRQGATAQTEVSVLYRIVPVWKVQARTPCAACWHPTLFIHLPRGFDRLSEVRPVQYEYEYCMSMSMNIRDRPMSY